MRRIRILALVQAGWAYAAIGREEAISCERAPQIVASAFAAGENETKLVHARAPIARLEPALRLAARCVADGELAAIDRLLRAPGRLDRYAAIDGAEAAADDGGRKRLLTKLNAMAETIKRRRERHGEAAPAKPVRQKPRPPLTRRTALISLTIPPRRQAPGLTSLDKT
ncbi:MAG: hypothetical protein ABSF49_21465 [Roseiarcus sp.]|uniref:hypothetical protein n=1 Tax=Roseiarcus sp. TaxID=1969460 RepID=UPI003C1E569E